VSFLQKRHFFSFISTRLPQRQFVLMQFVMLSMVLLFLLYGAYQIVQEFSLETIDQTLSPHLMRAELQAVYAALFARLLIVFLIGFLVNTVIGLIFLHRVTGPLVQTRHVLDTLSSGKFPEKSIRFRKDDLTPELAISLNRLVNYLRRERREGRAS
jgi:uncharacterized protein involved in cysteine biosynthesis